MWTGKFLMCIWFMFGVAGIISAQSSYSIPRFAVTFDFNTSFSAENAWGPRMQVYSNNNYFGKNRDRKNRLTENTIAYTYGLGFGGYKVTSLKKKNGSDDGLYLFFTSVALCYQNQGMFEPFAGIYPGVSWGIKSEFFVNPVAGINILAFRGRRNWNSLLFQTYAQARIEYNTMLSTTFVGCGIILQIM